MPVTPRPISERGHYHLMVRGNSKMPIFEERADYIHFLNNLKQYSSDHNIAINAYCLMPNHVHLLICDPECHKSIFMKRLAGNYAIWFNKKYGRSGHLFESRYVCKPIESDDLLCTVFRYILFNPMEAGICAPADYPWSSYDRYGNPNSFVDTKVLTELLGSFQEYAVYINSKNADMDIQIHRRDDEWAKKVIRERLHVASGEDLQELDWIQRNEAIRRLREYGLSIRQIERLTGISKGMIQRAIKDESE